MTNDIQIQFKLTIFISLHYYGIYIVLLWHLYCLILAFLLSFFSIYVLSCHLLKIIKNYMFFFIIY